MSSHTVASHVNVNVEHWKYDECRHGYAGRFCTRRVNNVIIGGKYDYRSFYYTRCDEHTLHTDKVIHRFK